MNRIIACCGQYREEFPISPQGFNGLSRFVNENTSNLAYLCLDIELGGYKYSSVHNNKNIAMNSDEFVKMWLKICAMGYQNYEIKTQNPFAVPVDMPLRQLRGW